MTTLKAWGLSHFPVEDLVAMTLTLPAPYTGSDVVSVWVHADRCLEVAKAFACGGAFAITLWLVHDKSTPWWFWDRKLS